MQEDSPRELWRAKAEEWDLWIGDEGDLNRRYQTDDVLWDFLGEVEGKKILDAGCGNGYLSVQLASQGAQVTGVDWSKETIEIARDRAQRLDQEVTFLIKDCQNLEGIEEETFDIVVCHHVLMDLPDYQSTLQHFHRVLKEGGRAVLLFSHPCFSVKGGPDVSEKEVSYRWDFSYFKEKKIMESWGPFRTPFAYYHRPLENYWKAFRQAGFLVLDLREPHLKVQPEDMTKEEFWKWRATPICMAFHLVKKNL